MQRALQPREFSSHPFLPPSHLPVNPEECAVQGLFSCGGTGCRGVWGGGIIPELETLPVPYLPSVLLLLG